MAGYFNDVHCHLFNFEDVPFYATLRRKVKPIDTLGMLAASLGIVNVDRFRKFIMFFELPVQANLTEFLAELREAAPGKNLLLTPLVMDFFDINPEAKPVHLQVEHLREGIAKCTTLSPGDRVLPFLGYDLRRLRSGSLDDFLRYWESSGGVSSVEKRSSPEALANGDVIGIKLYPPIGFNPDPSRERHAEIRKRYCDFYLWCIERRIPLTVHCQHSSYSMHSANRIRYYTHPLNWQKLLGRPGFGSLSINFAHAGGWEDMAEWQGTLKPGVSGGEAAKPESMPGSWSKVVVSLLKKYPNTYADLSAFNFASRSARNALKKLLERDERDQSGGYRLRKKLLWGSDIPMAIPAKACKQKGVSAYRHLYGRFAETILGCSIERPEEALLDMTATNPETFLFPSAQP
jgi:hypothetical protein